MSMKAFSATCGGLWRILWTWRVAVVAALLLGLFLPGYAPASQAQSVGSVMGGSAGGHAHKKGPKLVWLKIMAFTDAPVVGADVRVSKHGGKGRLLVDAHAATNEYGVFPVAVRSHPSVFRVSISGGTTNGNPFFGHLSADVVLADSAHQIVVINPVTTLVSLLLDEKPKLKLDGAEARVRSFLGLPENHSLGMALRESSRYASRFFSHVALLTEAEHATGDLDDFLHLLLQELLASPSATHPFSQPEVLEGTTTAAQDLADQLTVQLIKYEAGSGPAGWILPYTGLSSPSGPDEIAEVLQLLADVVSAIDELSNQVAQLTKLVQATATQTQYNTIVVPAQALADELNGVASDLSYFAQACPPLPDGSTPTTPDNFCKNQKVSLTTELNDVTIQQAYVTLQGYVGDNPTIGFRGMLHLYSLWLAQSKVFFRPADSTKMQDLYNFWDATLTQALNLKIELLHENGAQDNPGGVNELNALMGQFQTNETANLKLMFPPVPVDTVVATQDHRMWSLLPWQEYRQNVVPFQYRYRPATGCYVDIGAWIGLSQYADQGYAGFSNWDTAAPSKAQWQAVVNSAPSGTNWQNWLIAQTNTTSDESPASTGFYNIVQNCHNGGAWTYDYTYWDVAVLDQSKFINTNNASYFLWPTRDVSGSEQYFWYE